MIELADVVDLPLFAQTPHGALERALVYAADVHANAGEYLVHEGEICNFYVLLSGKFELTKRLGTTERLLVVRETRGDYFGEIPLMLGTTAFCNVHVIEAARLMCLDGHAFRNLFHDSSAFAANVMRSVHERLSGVQAVTNEPLPAEVSVVGHCLEPECHEIRDFLARAHVAFDFVSLDRPEVDAAIKELALTRGDGPFVKIKDRLMVKPTLRELAEAAGLRVRAGAHTYDVAIVGGGPSGLAAAVYGASEGLSTVLFERDAPGGQAGTSSRIENYLGFPTGLSGDDLATRAVAQASRFGAELVVTRTVTGIEAGGGMHRVVLDGGESVAARAIVIANGVSWRTLDVPGVARFVGAGVFYGAARTEAPSIRGTDVYLVGGGNSAGQAAMFFSNYARTVTLLVRGDDLARSMSDYLIKELKTKENVAVRVHSDVTGAFGERRLERIEVRDRSTGARTQHETGGLFIFIGADADTAWIPPAILRDERGYVLTGIAMQCAAEPTRAWPLERDALFLETSVPGIFAAGDVRAGSVKRCAAGVGEGSMAIALTHQYLEEIALAAT